MVCFLSFVDTGNIIGVYDSELEALAAVRDLLDANPPEFVTRLALVFGSRQVLAGAALAARAFAVLEPGALPLDADRSGCEGNSWTESDWQELCTLRLRSGQLMVCEAMGIPGEDDMMDVIIHVRPGYYGVRIRRAIFAPGDTLVSRLQVARQNPKAVLASEVGTVYIDGGQVAVGDYGVLFAAWSADKKAQSEALYDTATRHREDAWVYTPPGVDTLVPIVRSGLGDGGYPIRELLVGEERVGVEIQFWPPPE